MHPFALAPLLLLLAGCGAFGLSGADEKSSDSGPPPSVAATDTSDASRRIEGTEAGDCRDGADNDGDGLFDCDDPGCTGSPDCDPSGSSGAGSSGDNGSSGGSSGADGSGDGSSGEDGSSDGSSEEDGSGSGSGSSGSGSSGSGSSGSGSSGSGSSGTTDTGSTDSSFVCLETCRWSNDGVCDDGGTGSSNSACDFGTDCIDCGPRDPCTDDCTPWSTSAYAGDGDCDDGASDSVSSLCDVGTDCTDCGSRAP